MKKYIFIAILTTFSIMETMAQFPPTKEQLANIKKIEELQKSNKEGKNKAEIIKLLNANQKVNEEIAIERAKQMNANQKVNEEIAIERAKQNKQ